MHFDLKAELDRLREQDTGRQGAGASSATLVKHNDLRIVLAELRSGESLPEHRARGSVTVHVLKGWVRMRLPEQIEDLKAGQFMALAPGIAHDVHALEDSAFLLTLAWPGPDPAS